MTSADDDIQQVKPSDSPFMLREEGNEYYLQITKFTGKLYETPPKPTKMDELSNTKEEIKKARERVVQSWLDSKPLIDQLEKLQLDLKNAKTRSSMATVVIPELETHLETTNASIQFKKENEIETRATIEELGKSLEKVHDEMEALKVETDNKRRARAKLKQEVRLRKQTLRSLQLTLRAVRIESEALRSSAADALFHISKSNTDDEATVQLTHEEYQALTRRANEEMELTDWRVSVSMEQKHAAEASQDEALRRLKDIHTGNILRKRGMEENILPEIREQEIEVEAEKDGLRKEKPTHGNNRASLQEILVTANDNSFAQNFTRPRNNHNKKMATRKKSSILHQIKSLFCSNGK
ncbi:hypothetical protein FRX31_010055 [Thalictrum thalictroides]|uniref:WEB family protein n=1 Tax=Thalictrum thalictroides TaxID=46969 RepID=A0A7J6WV37_THATH|nr:hypothetical protein FRX31_010055 [Thalictrum thalictroides]